MLELRGQRGGGIIPFSPSSQLLNSTVRLLLPIIIQSNHSALMQIINTNYIQNSQIFFDQSEQRENTNMREQMAKCKSRQHNARANTIMRKSENNIIFVFFFINMISFEILITKRISHRGIYSSIKIKFSQMNIYPSEFRNSSY